MYLSEQPKENSENGDFLAVQWLRLCLSMLGVWVRSLAGELRYHMPQCSQIFLKKIVKIPDADEHMNWIFYTFLNGM